MSDVIYFAMIYNFQNDFKIKSTFSSLVDKQRLHNTYS